ncbi:hypothetical protein DFP95_1241 [Cohnella lupini]|uniref:DNA mismatch repair protein n=2 Tax=Cohnella lupini TaxID=1294267 RepID=A0A3D9HYH4_9BACL|nr:hypothetical protein DFP95_1241 [Cohnella lupini]
MSETTIDDPSSKNHSRPVRLKRHKVSRESVIGLGMNYLHELGADHICNVCIYNGGSCCGGCEHLSNGAGCKLRNTSCTAWLCGFLKYVLYETGHLRDWNAFWAQVPGLDHRMDYTPEQFFIRVSLEAHTLKELSASLAEDLKELSKAHVGELGFILTVREQLDRYIDLYLFCDNDIPKQKRVKKQIDQLSVPFHRFREALSLHRRSFEKSE